MSERERLSRRIAAIDFALVELHLFLDSHPNNKEVANKLEEYQTKSSELRAQYEEKFGPLSPIGKNGNRWSWISNPWPWDNTEEADS